MLRLRLIIYWLQACRRRDAEAAAAASAAMLDTYGWDR